MVYRSSTMEGIALCMLLLFVCLSVNSTIRATSLGDRTGRPLYLPLLPSVSPLTSSVTTDIHYHHSLRGARRAVHYQRPAYKISGSPSADRPGQDFTISRYSEDRVDQ